MFTLSMSLPVYLSYEQHPWVRSGARNSFINVVCVYMDDKVAGLIISLA